MSLSGFCDISDLKSPCCTWGTELKVNDWRTTECHIRGRSRTQWLTEFMVQTKYFCKAFKILKPFMKNHQIYEVSWVGIWFRHSGCKCQVSLRLPCSRILHKELGTAGHSHYIRHRGSHPPWWRQWVPMCTWLHSLGIYSCFCHLPHIKLELGTCLSDLHFIIWKKWRVFW